jgi:hypothetical protein
MEASSNIFVFALRDTLTERDLETTSIQGPITVEASDEDAGRLLLAMNFGLAASRVHGEMAPTCVWSDRASSSCIRVGASVKPYGTTRAGLLARETIDLGDGRTAKILSVCH